MKKTKDSVEDLNVPKLLRPNEIKKLLRPNEIKFYNSKGECVGTLHLDDDPIWFEGNVDESAKLFLDKVIKECMNWRNLYENR